MDSGPSSRLSSFTVNVTAGVTSGLLIGALRGANVSSEPNNMSLKTGPCNINSNVKPATSLPTSKFCLSNASKTLAMRTSLQLGLFSAVFHSIRLGLGHLRNLDDIINVTIAGTTTGALFGVGIGAGISSGVDVSVKTADPWTIVTSSKFRSGVVWGAGVGGALSLCGGTVYFLIERLSQHLMESSATKDGKIMDPISKEDEADEDVPSPLPSAILSLERQIDEANKLLSQTRT